MLEHRRCANNIAQGNALGIRENRWNAALKGHYNVGRLFRPYRALPANGLITQGVALGYNVTAPSVLKDATSKRAIRAQK
jgi:hypothetical protein